MEQRMKTNNNIQTFIFKRENRKGKIGRNND